MKPADILKAAQDQHEALVAKIVDDVLEQYQTGYAYRGGYIQSIDLGGYSQYLALAVINKLREKGWTVHIESLIDENEAKATIIVLKPEVS